MRLGIAAALALVVSSSVAASTFDPSRPPAIPLAVKSPYLNIWLKAGPGGGNGGYLAGEWPSFWNDFVVGWTGFIRVDGLVYRWMGAAPGAAADVDQTAFYYTSTRSTFIMDVAGKVEMNITFLSPVTPNDLRRQSLTFSYLNAEVRSLDGRPHSVQLYSDVSAELASGDRGAQVKWDYGVADGVAYHRYYRRAQIPIQEHWEQADWGNWYWSTKDSPQVSYQSGADAVVRRNFIRNGKLPDSKDTSYRAINKDWPVFAFAVELGTVSTSPVDTLFTIGVSQVEAIDFQGHRREIVPNLWTSYFKTGLDSMVFFYEDFNAVSAICAALDIGIESDSLKAAGPEYLILTSLSVRQVFGALQFTGTPDRPLIFIKEISSNSDIQTVDVIFPAHPMLLYLNPSLLRYMLDPLYENQESGHYPKNSAIHDLGTFPVARGYPDGNDEEQPLEECGNMVIMTLAYAQRSGDADYLARHYPLLKRWAGYLVNDSLVPYNQLSTDDFAGKLANQTNLALKGIVALGAMGHIARAAADRLPAGSGAVEDSFRYGAVAASYLAQWRELGGVNDRADPPHATLSYDRPESHGLLYNLYADRLLGLSLVPRDVYDMQARFYPTVALRHGVPLDTRHRYTKSDWQMFCAAAALTAADEAGGGFDEPSAAAGRRGALHASSSPKEQARLATQMRLAREAGLATRAMFVSKLARWVGETRTHRAFTDLYDAEHGGYPDGGPDFIARPVMGAMFALLALEPYTPVILGKE